jgi:hypothetical protein
METSREEQRNREETYNMNSPCYFFEQVFKSFLKCLGHDDSTTEQPLQDPPSHAEGEIKSSVNLFLSHTNTHIYTQREFCLMCFL